MRSAVMRSFGSRERVNRADATRQLQSELVFALESHGIDPTKRQFEMDWSAILPGC
jgi:hypothetical protein